MGIKRFIPDRHILELTPFLIILSLLPFLNGGESDTAKIIFFAFSIFFLMIIVGRRRKINRPFRLVFWLWIAFLLVSFVSTAFSISLTFSVPKFFELVGVFLYFVFFFLIIERDSDLKFIAFSIVAVGFILSLVSLYFIYSPPKSLPGMNLIYAAFGHNHLSDYLLYVVPVVIVMFIGAKKKRSNILLGLLLAFFFLSFFLTFARAALVILSLVTIFLVWFYKPAFVKALYLTTIGLLPLALIAVFLVISHSRLSQEFAALKGIEVNWLKRQVVKPLNQESRIEYWRQAKEGFALRPIFGNGPGTFRLTSRRFQQKQGITSWFAHNSLLQSLSETGFFGFSFFALLLFFSITKIKNLPSKPSYATALFVGISGSLLQSLLDFNFDFLAIFLLFWVLIAVLLKLSPRRRLSSGFPRLAIYLATFLCFAFALSSLLSSMFLREARRMEPVSAKRAFEFHKFSALLPAMETDRFLTFLRSVADDEQATQAALPERAILYWNKEDPDIYSLLAQANRQSSESLLYYKRMAPFSSPYEKVALMQHILRSDLSDNDFSVDLFIDILVHTQSTQLEQEFETLAAQERQKLKPYVEKFYDPMILDTTQIRWWASKVFYFTGLEFLKDNVSDYTQKYWEWARILSPDFDYFQIEVASLGYHLFNDASGARAILTECLENQYSYQSCANQLRQPLEYLPMPGSYSDRIEKINYR